MSLLSEAFSAIPKQKLIFQGVISETVNDIGMKVEELSPKKVVYGSFQPVPRKLYAENGLDFQKRYFTFYTEQAAYDIYRGQTGDYLEYCCIRYKILSKNDWLNYDGWIGVLCVQVEEKE